MIMEISYDAAIPNTFGLNVKADRLVRFHSDPELESVIAEILNGGLKPPFLCLGEGSNMLFSSDYHGTVLVSEIRGIGIMNETEEETILRIGSGHLWNDFTAYCSSKNLFGAENLSGIPGTVGAAAVQNIGAYGAEVENLISSVETVDLETGDKRSFQKEECKYAYRDSLFKKAESKRYLITYVNMRMSGIERYSLEYGRLKEETGKYDEINLENVRNAVISIRKDKLPDPSMMGSAGSFFKNPVIDKENFALLAQRYPKMPHYPAPDGNGIKLSAAWLIDQCGWKGRKMGKAAIWERQPLVIVNTGGASPEDITNIANAVAESVSEKFGIRLDKEVQFV